MTANGSDSGSAFTGEGIGPQLRRSSKIIGAMQVRYLPRQLNMIYPYQKLNYTGLFGLGLFTPYVPSLEDEDMPVSGEIRMFGGASAPTGWLLCQGQAVSRTTYADLFAAIGTTYGAGDGSTTFNLPNFSEKLPIGAGGGKALGSTGGAENVTLVEANLPAHGHSIKCDAGGSGIATDDPFGGYPGLASTDTPWSSAQDSLMASDAVSNTGSGTSFSVLPPYQAVNFIIAE